MNATTQLDIDKNLTLNYSLKSLNVEDIFKVVNFIDLIRIIQEI